MDGQIKSGAQECTVATDGRLEFYGSNFASFIPFLVFIVGVVILCLNGGFSLEAFVGLAVVGLILGTFFAKNWGTYWDAVMRGITDNSTGIVAAIFLLAGVFSNLMAKGARQPSAYGDRLLRHRVGCPAVGCPAVPHADAVGATQDENEVTWNAALHTG